MGRGVYLGRGLFIFYVVSEISFSFDVKVRRGRAGFRVDYML